MAVRIAWSMDVRGAWRMAIRIARRMAVKNCMEHGRVLGLYGAWLLGLRGV